MPAYLLVSLLLVVSSASFSTETSSDNVPLEDVYPALMSVADYPLAAEQANVVTLEIQPLAYFQQSHIKNSVRTNYDDWRQKRGDGLNKMLPEKRALDKLIGGLGISEQSHVIIVPIGRGPGDMAAAARIYWTLHVVGLERLSILDGGMLAYRAQFLDQLVKGNNQAKPTEFSANIHADGLLSLDDVQAAIDAGESIVDARSPTEYVGLVAGGEKERPGAMPTAVNLNYDAVMNAADTGLKTVDNIMRTYWDADVPLEGPQIFYCHTGHRAALSWFVSHELLGNQAARLYDGSTLEWSSTADRPLVVHQDKQASLLESLRPQKLQLPKIKLP